jgi:hypothetical protein
MRGVDHAGVEAAYLGLLPARGGRSGWAHLEFTRICIELTIRGEKVEDLMNVRGVGEKSFLKLKPLITVAPVKGEPAGQ